MLPYAKEDELVVASLYRVSIMFPSVLKMIAEQSSGVTGMLETWSELKENP